MPPLAAVPTFFLVSIMPGLCMTLAMTMGMTIGVRRTLWMMAGELVGVGLVAALAILGVAALLASSPAVYWAARCAGAAYLVLIGLRLWAANAGAAASAGQPAIGTGSLRSLMSQGFVAAVTNPKAWILYASLFPPFLDPSRRIGTQIPALLLLMLAIEFGCLLLYATGGRVLVALLQRPDVVRMVNLAAGAVIIALACGLLALG
ncbi:MAG TPA: LysE family translocator [Inquilinus sp.]|nr:LysE family translocator [Inquilinus sp.]